MPKSKRRPPNRRGGTSARRRSAEPDLEQIVASLLAEPHPLGLLMHASTIAEVLEDERSGVDLDQFVATLVPRGSAASSALLALLDLFLPGRIPPDALEHAAPAPDRVRRLGEARIVRTLLIEEPSREIDQLAVEVQLPGGDLLCVLTLIDHWAGSSITDLATAPIGIEEVLAVPLQQMQGRGLEVRELPVADAVQRLRESADVSTLVLEPPESESWPQGRPLARWIAGLAPAGGAGWPVASTSPESLQTLAKRVVARHGAALGPDADDVVLTLVTWASQHAPFGQPLHWSARSVGEVFDWIDDHVVADEQWHRQVPSALRALVRAAGLADVLPSDAIDDALREIDAFDEEGGALADLRDQFAEYLPDESLRPERLLHRLRLKVGGEEALEALTTEPLEPTPADDLPDDVRDRVARISAMVHSTGRSFFDDPELPAVAEDLLVRVAVAAPALLRRRGDPRMTAAAALWIVGKVNDAFLDRKVQDLMAAFDLKGSASQRATTLIDALGLGEWSGHQRSFLGDPRLLTVEHRRDVLRKRDGARQALEAGSDGLPSAVTLPDGSTVQIEHRPGLAAEVLEELRPHLQAQGVDLDDEPDLDRLQSALAIAQETRNTLLFAPTADRRAAAAAALRHFATAMHGGDGEQAEVVLAGIQPQAPDAGTPEVSAVIGLGLELLDHWLGDAPEEVPIGLAGQVRLPRDWSKRARPGVEIVALASRGRAHPSLRALIARHGGLQVLTATALAVAVATEAWASKRGEPLEALLDRVVR